VVQAAETNVRLAASPEWGDQQFAAFRIGYTVSRIGQLRKEDALIWRRDGNGPILVSPPSVDQWLKVQGQAPQFEPLVILHPAQARQTLTLGQ
jgi:hypothetical protein